MKKLLPLGSVVLLEKGVVKVMIIGRLQRSISDDVIYDYAACPFPDGLMSDEHVFLFQHEDINIVCFNGYENEEEAEYQLQIEKYLQEHE